MKTAYVIMCVKLVGEVVVNNHPGQSQEGMFLLEYEPEHANGRGFVTWTSSIEEAKKYASLEEAADEIFTVPKARPRRDDGQANMPLRAYALEVLPVTWEAT